MTRVPLLCAFLLLLGAGCATTVDLFDPAMLSAASPDAYSDREWATVLRENAKDGLVDYTHLRDHAQPVESHLDQLAVVGPESTPDLFPDRATRLAYYVNAYNAGVLAAVLHENVPPAMHGVGRRSLEQGYRMLVDRRPQTLADLRAAAGAQSAGDARVEFYLCDAAKGSPPLPDRPLRAETLEQDLQRVARQAMDNQNMVSVDHENTRLNIALVIFQQQDVFLDFHKQQTGARSTTLLSVLLHMADGVRREWLNTAVGYKVGMIPFDRSLNAWKAETLASP